MARVLRLLHAMEDAIVLLLLFSMMAIAGGQIVARNFFDVGFNWAEPSLRIMVLWLGMVGAMLATRDQRHITVDVLSHALGPRGRSVVARLNNTICAFVCGLLAWHGVKYIQLEREYPLEGALGMPTWVLALILPIAFGLMTLRFVIHALSGRVPKPMDAL